MSVLVVCTANVCRSPLAARLLSVSLGRSLGVAVTSAGVRATPGMPACPTATAFTPAPVPLHTSAPLLAADPPTRADHANRGRPAPRSEQAIGADHANRGHVATRLDDAIGFGHVSVRLEAAHVRSASLVLGAAREHRAAAIGLVPNAQRKAFTLLQAARLATWLAEQGVTAPPELVGPERLRWWVDELDAVRGDAPRGRPEDDDLPDPHDGGVRHDLVLPRLAHAADALAAVLT